MYGCIKGLSYIVLRILANFSINPFLRSPWLIFVPMVEYFKSFGNIDMDGAQFGVLVLEVS